MDYKHRLVVRHAVRSQVAARRCQWQTFMGGEHDKRQDQSSALKRSAGQKSLVGYLNSGQSGVVFLRPVPSLLRMIAEELGSLGARQVWGAAVVTMMTSSTAPPATIPSVMRDFDLLFIPS